MRLTEILRVGQRNGLKPEAIKHDTATVVGKFEGNDIWNIKQQTPTKKYLLSRKMVRLCRLFLEDFGKKTINSTLF